VPLEVLEGQSDARPAPIPMFLSGARRFTGTRYLSPRSSVRLG
jgi:hypothetical protein